MMQRGLICSLVAVLLFVMTGPIRVGAQSSNDKFFIHQFSLEQGLSSRMVAWVAQDPLGFLWIATPNGINRFDGYEFKLFSRDADGLVGKNIRQIYCAKDHTLWYVTVDGGLGLFDWYTLRAPDSTLPIWKFPFDATEVELLNPVDDSSIVVSSETIGNWSWSRSEGWERFGPSGMDVVRDALRHPATGDKYIATMHDLWFLPAGSKAQMAKLTDKGAMLVKPLDGNRVLVKVNDGHLGPDEDALQVVDAQGIHTDPLLHEVGRRLPSSFTHAISAAYLIWSAGNYFLFDERQIIVLDAQFNVVSEDMYHDQAQQSISAFYKVLRQEKITLTTTNNGFLVIAPKYQYFTNYLAASGNADHNSIRGMSRMGDSLLVASYQGNFMVSLHSGAYRRIFSGKIHPKGVPLNLIGLGISDSKTDGKWLCEFSAIHWSPKTGASRFIDMPVYDEVRQVLEGPNDRLWLATLRGLFIADPKDSVARLAFPETPNDPLSHASVYRIKPGRSGNWWICTAEGLVAYDPQTTQRKLYQFMLPGRKSFGVKVFDAYEDREGYLWVGTQDRGLIRMNVASGAWTSYGRAEGLSNETIYTVVEDKQGRLWLSSDYGLMAFDRKNGTTRIFHKEDGIPEEEFNSGAFYEDADGRFYFGTVNGIVAFHPDSILLQEEDDISFRLISIQRVYGDNADSTAGSSELSWKPGETLYLPSSENGIEIKFALLDWKSPGEGAYSYRIEGLDDHWKFTSQNFLTLDGWHWGDYKIRIRARSPRGNWLKEEIVIPISVSKPIYLRTWFILLAISIPFFLVYLRFRSLKRRKIALEREVESRTEVIRQDKARIEQQAQELAKLDEAKSRFFANVSHELRTPLTLILGPINAAIKKLKPEDPILADLTVVKENSKNLLSSIEEMLDISKLERGELVLFETPVHLRKLLLGLTEPFKIEAKRRGLSFAISIAIEPDLLVQADQTGLVRILTNLLSNAFKFTTDGGNVIFAIQDTGNFISFSVTDSGKGIDPKELPFIFDRYYQAEAGKTYMGGGSGIGLSLAKDYADLMKGRIEVKSKHGEGSEFVFWMPKVVATQRGGSIPHEEDHPLEAADDVQESLQVLSQRHTVLVTEDNVQLAAFLLSILETEHHVLLAVNGEDALTVLDKHREVSLVLTDLMMPVMDGFALIHSLKSDPRYLDKPVIVLTARAGREDRLRVLNTGVDDYITKPFDEEELKIRIRNLLHRVELKKMPAAEITEQDDNDKGPVNPADLAWLHEVEEFVRRSITDPRLSREFLADHLGMGDRTMTRKLTKIVGIGPAKYIQEIRLQVGRELLESGRVTSIKQVASETGFDTPAYFSKLFRHRFGKDPIAKG